MKTKNKIFIAFILNLAFSIFELFGGIVSKSNAILSDAIHDFGDALAIFISLIFENKSIKTNNKHYSHTGGKILTITLIIGCISVIANSVYRLFNPVKINYNEMIVFAITGFVVNLIATVVTSGGESYNQRAVNLHMFEDVLGWAVVLIGAIVMRFTDFYILDPLMSIGISIFILINAINNTHHHH